MKVFTHHSGEKKPLPRSYKILMAVCLSITPCSILFLAVVLSIEVKSVTPALIILLPFAAIALWVHVITRDMEKAYVEITDDTITVVDYYYGVRKEKQFRTCDIVSTEVISGYSLRVRGYRHSYMGICYRIFRGEKGRYLFKLIDIPESAASFQRYLDRLATGNS